MKINSLGTSLHQDLKKHVDKLDFKTKKLKKSKRKLRNVPKDAATAIKKKKPNCENKFW